MSKPKRQYSLGKYRLRVPKEADKNKPYAVVLEYTWERKVIRKTTNILVRIADWNQELHQGRGGVRAGYGPEAKRINSVLLARVDKIDSLLAEYNHKHPNEINAEVITDFLNDKPIIRDDKGRDFIEFVNERLASDYSRKRIGRSRYENGRSGMNIFQQFLRATNNGTYKPDSIYVGEISVELVDAYIQWRREFKQNSDATINHSLTPILKGCAYAAELKMLDPAINARIQDMRIVIKPSLAGEEADYDGKNLTAEELDELVQYCRLCEEERRKEFIEMFLFSFHACGLRVVDVMTLQWSHVDFERKELRKIMVKTSKRHVIPLSDPAIAILKKWRKKRPNSKFVFDLVKDDLDVNDEEKLYKARNNATKCINQSLIVVGEAINLKFNLTMHVARHTFAVFALNKGLSMSVVSRLLGHGSTDITEKVYARFLPETLSTELSRLAPDMKGFLP